MKDLYLVLGITKEASPEIIKKAYRKLALDLHPDKGGDSDKMSLINEAYEALSDPNKREKFDEDWDIFQATDADYAPHFEAAGIIKAGNIVSYSHAYKEQHKSLVAKYALTPMQQNKHESFPSFKSGTYHIEEQGKANQQYHDIFTFIRAKAAKSVDKNLFTLKDNITIVTAIKLFRDFLSGSYYGADIKAIKAYLSSEIKKSKIERLKRN